MPPQSISKTQDKSPFPAPAQEESSCVTQREPSKQTTKTEPEYPGEKDENWKCMDHIIWPYVMWFVILHVGALYGGYLAFTSGSRKTSYFGIFCGLVAGMGITAGAHRLWTHRAYKAKLPLRIFLAICNTAAIQNSIYQWSRDHRIHHKYSETDADPHNSRRGFFFSHMGWLCCKKHPDVKRFGKKIDMSDLRNDPVVYYQRKYYVLWVLLFSFLMPTAIPCYFWNETPRNAFFIAVLFRYCISLHFTWLVNSAAHFYGNRPYDMSIAPAENLLVSTLALGEGYHNFHHTFPFDYSTSEWGWSINISTMFIDTMAFFGLAYDLRKVTPEMIAARQTRTGKANSHDYERRKTEFA